MEERESLAARGDAAYGSVVVEEEASPAPEIPPLFTATAKVSPSSSDDDDDEGEAAQLHFAKTALRLRALRSAAAAFKAQGPPRYLLAALALVVCAVVGVLSGRLNNAPFSYPADGWIYRKHLAELHVVGAAG
jgi:hypothetical protein